MQTRVDDLHPGVAKRAGDDLRAAIVPVEAGLRHDHTDLAPATGSARCCLGTALQAVGESSGPAASRVGVSGGGVAWILLQAVSFADWSSWSRTTQHPRTSRAGALGAGSWTAQEGVRDVPVPSDLQEHHGSAPHTGRRTVPGLRSRVPGEHPVSDERWGAEVRRI